MFEVFDKFFGDDFLGFGEPTLMYYNANHTQDIHPVYWEKQESADSESDKFDIYRATVRSVGVSKDDVKVTVDNQKYQINVGGITNTNGIDYDFACSLPVAKTILSNIDHIYYDTIDGITYVYLYVKKNESKIRIEYKDMKEANKMCSHEEYDKLKGNK